MVGGALIVCSANESRYEIAAYDRDLFDKPLGHLVQFKAIEESKKEVLLIILLEEGFLNLITQNRLKKKFQFLSLKKADILYTKVYNNE